VLCLLLAAAGCGQKGPLFLPGDPHEGRIVLPEELGGPPRDEAAPDAESEGESEDGEEPRSTDDGQDDEQ